MTMKLIHSTVVLGLALAVGVVTGPALGQDHPKSATATAAKSRGDSTGKDENIKKDAAPNDPNAKVEAPPEKGGPKTRGGSCFIDVDNRSPYYISIYTDGDYRGQVSPFGDLVGYVGCGNTRLYARANFRDGTYQTWGPSVYDLGEGSFKWTLRP
jgi:hypothetical protein